MLSILESETEQSEGLLLLRNGAIHQNYELRSRIRGIRDPIGILAMMPACVGYRKGFIFRTTLILQFPIAECHGQFP